MSKLIGTWELIQSDGFDDFLKNLGKTNYKLDKEQHISFKTKYVFLKILEQLSKKLLKLIAQGML